MASTIIPVKPFDFVIFGATGDLSRRKILPALLRRVVAGQIPEGSRIIGASRRDLSSAAFKDIVDKAITEFVGDNKFPLENYNAFMDMLSYVTVDVMSEGGWQNLKSVLEDSSNVINAFYLSVSPSLIGSITENMRKFSLLTQTSRIVVEKPLGTDYKTAKELNTTLRKVFDESQIYRIDHYLGKETVQNLMALRFANVFLEPLWNNKYIDHVQITVAENVSIEGRGGYYDQSGAMRDMVQNHLMQLLCLVAMEPPSSYEADAVRNEKLKVIGALEPVNVENTVRGQYRASADQGSYLQHVDDHSSRTESYVAIKTEMANWRWAGVPFYLRTGKCLNTRASEIAIVFKPLQHHIFSQYSEVTQNTLVIHLQPHEGITMNITVKEPGPGGMRLADVPLDMSFADMTSEQVSLDAYERLIMDCIRGDQTLFMRGDEVEAAWQWTDHIIEQWQKIEGAPFAYDIGSAGPKEADKLLRQDGREWREIK